MNAVYWPSPNTTPDERRRAYLEYSAAQSPGELTGFFSQIARLELGRTVDERPLREAMERVDQRVDCSDFAVAGLLRILYKYRASQAISPALVEDIAGCLLRFKYWWDEPGDDRMCYFTENHQIIFHADELLAGQLFAKRAFSNSGLAGDAHVTHATSLIRRWMTWRARFGFSEWLSNCYIDEDLVALVNLYDFAADPAIRCQAGQLIDLLMLEMALHSYRGVMGSTHGRSYAAMIKSGRGENTASAGALMFGLGLFTNPSSLSAVALATSSYRLPPAIAAVAGATEARVLSRERQSLDVVDAPRFGLRYDNPDALLFFWSLHTFHHPEIVEASLRAKNTYRTYPVFEPYEETVGRYRAEIAHYGRVVTPYGEAAALTEVNIETLRTPSYMLSCAQDYRAGKPGCQQHIWQATLGLDGVVFTNHPGTVDELNSSRPNFWAGNGILPRAAQHENVVVCIHHIPADNALPFSHAYVPRLAFDEVVERDGWLCARKGDGYLALHSENAMLRTEQDEAEARAVAPDNVWVCEMGDQAQWGGFGKFLSELSSVKVDCHDLQVSYQSPSQGLVEFGWDEPLRVQGASVPLRGYKRFDNPYCQCAFDQVSMTIDAGGEKHELDLSAPFSAT